MLSLFLGASLSSIDRHCVCVCVCLVRRFLIFFLFPAELLFLFDPLCRRIYPYHYYTLETLHQQLTNPRLDLVHFNVSGRLSDQMTGHSNEFFSNIHSVGQRRFFFFLFLSFLLSGRFHVDVTTGPRDVCVSNLTSQNVDIQKISTTTFLFPFFLLRISVLSFQCVLEVCFEIQYFFFFLWEKTAAAIATGTRQGQWPRFWGDICRSE